MNEILAQSSYFGFVITAIVFYLSLVLKNKFKSTLLNPLLITTVIIVIILLLFNIKYDTYNASAKYISYFLTPTTVCLAIPLYKQIKVLKSNVIAIISGITAGVLANFATILIFSNVFNLNKKLSLSLLSKSITAPIAIGVTNELGGISSITVFAVILSGIIGAAIAPTIFKIFKIRRKVAKGLACGTSAHGSGTTTALQLGEVEGAMSGLAIIITGLITTIIAPIISSIFF
ncbi:MAG: LrgB family protein [Bacilli bacterium]|nr:LrgB family protein [Bacilli bacterium]